MELDVAEISWGYDIIAFFAHDAHDFVCWCVNYRDAPGRPITYYDIVEFRCHAMEWKNNLLTKIGLAQ